MRFTIPFTLFAALATAVDVTVQNLDQDFTIQCGKTQIEPVDIFNAVSLGVNLKHNNQVYTSNVGKMYTYPRHFNNGPGFKNFHSPTQCDPNANGRDEFPLIVGGTFQDHSNQGIYRSVYYFDGAMDGTNLLAYYCGTIYHAGEKFLPCDISSA